MDKGRWWVKDYTYNIRNVVWTNSNILWVDKLTSHFSSYDEQNPKESDQHWGGGQLYWQCNSGNRGRGETWWGSKRSGKNVREK